MPHRMPQSYRATELQSYRATEPKPYFLNFKNRQQFLNSMLFLVLSSIFYLPLKAQLIGWPSASSIAEVDLPVSQTINSTAITYMDNNRARVTSQTLVTSSPLVYDLQLTNLASGASFALNKWCAIVQMTGTGVGANCMVKTTAFNTSTNIMRIQVLTGNTWPSYDFATASRVQLVRIPVYWNLTLTKGEISCHAFDYSTGTGGLLPLIIGGTITINGGYFNVSNNGYINDWVGGVSALGNGGTGLLAPAWTGNGGGCCPGMPSSPTGPGTWSGPNICYNGINPQPTIPTFDIGNPGEIGDGANNPNAMNPALGTTTNTANILRYYPTTPSVSTPHSILRMGNAGDAGINSGAGAGGGGTGGYGGMNGLGVGYYINGLRDPGLNGGNGGDPAQGGRGGGTMYLKFANTTISSKITAVSGYKLFFGDGQQGGNGEQGANGGNGGVGRIGQDGICANGTELATTGGWGGFGKSGRGAGGGEGGNGGKPGTIWIIKKSPGTHPSSLTAYCSIKGGKGGGRGGYSKIYYENYSARNYNPALNSTNYPCLNGVNYTICPIIPAPCRDEVCDCDMVFKHWGEDGTLGTGYTVDATTNPNVWELQFSNGTPTIYFDRNTKNLYYYKISTLYNAGGLPYQCTTKYNCYMVKQDMFLDIMKKAYKVSPLQTYTPPNTGGNVTVGTNYATYNAIPFVGSFFTNIYFNNNGHPVLKYDPATDVLTDLDNPGKRTVQAMNCDATFEILPNGNGGGNPPELEVQNIIIKLEKTGDDGAEAPDETDGNDPDNMSEQNGGGLPPPPNNDNNDGEVETTFIAYQPSIVKNINQQLDITLKAQEISQWQTCSLYTADGKLLGTKTLENGKVLFAYPTAGVYIIIFNGNGKTTSQKVLTP